MLNFEPSGGNKYFYHLLTIINIFNMHLNFINNRVIENPVKNWQTIYGLERAQHSEHT